MKPQRDLNLTPEALAILEDRYLQAGETPQDLFTRVSSAIAQAETLSERSKWQKIYSDLMTSLDFLPNSPTLVNAGTGKGCLSACFVMSPEDNLESIMEVATNAAMTEKWGGGIGFGLSKIRPKGSSIETVHGEACGPISVMSLYSQVGATLTQGSFRLGAHMAQLHISHPDVQEFIHCKDNDDKLKNFNISIQVTDEFMNAVANDDVWRLSWKAETDTLKARYLWNEICESAWRTGDPGVVFIDQVQRTKPIPFLEINTSNPCGEEFLEEYNSCNLGSINLANHLLPELSNIDYTKLTKTVTNAVRFLDDVVEVNKFPLDIQKTININTRRIGLGVMGWADLLLALKVPYDSDYAVGLARTLSNHINKAAVNASRGLAEEKGVFPFHDRSTWTHPMRNASVTTIAPTGTISRLADVNFGIEPYYAKETISSILWKGEGEIGAPTQEHYKKLVGSPFLRTALEIEPIWHVHHLAAWQEGTTNSVSKTINLPNMASVEEVDRAFTKAWNSNCKAVTVYRDGSKSNQVLNVVERTPKIAVPRKHPQPLRRGFRTPKEVKGAVELIALQGDYRVNELTAKTLRIHTLEVMARPDITEGISTVIETGHGPMTATLNTLDDRPFEVFTTLRGNKCYQADMEAINRLASIAIRAGIEANSIASVLSGASCCPHHSDGKLNQSPQDALGLFIREQLGETIEIKNLDETCDYCSSGPVIFQEGCSYCLNCNKSKCE